MRWTVKIWLCLSLALGAVAEYDKYADALAKYKKWQEKYGNKQSDLANRVNNQQIKRRPNTVQAVPHIYAINQFVIPESEYGEPVIREHSNYIASNLQFVNSNGDLDADNVVRDTRNTHQLPVIIKTRRGGSEYIHSSGVPLYKIRKRYPHGYGRKRRSAGIQGWFSGTSH